MSKKNDLECTCVYCQFVQRGMTTPGKVTKMVKEDFHPEDVNLSSAEFFAQMELYATVDYRSEVFN